MSEDGFIDNKTGSAESFGVYDDLFMEPLNSCYEIFI